MASDTTTPTRRFPPSIMESHPLLRDLEVPSETIAPLLGRTQHGPDYRAVNESARTPARLTGLRSCCPPSLAPFLHLSDPVAERSRHRGTIASACEERPSDSAAEC